MSTAILVHPTCLTLTPLPLPTPSSASSPPSSQSLSLPSRFPSAPPHSAHAPNGNAFIWSTASTVWEYDARGRRVGEITLPSASSEIVAVAPFERGVAIASNGEKGEVRVYRRGGGAGQARWALAHTIAAKGAEAMSAGDGVLVVCGEEVCAYALESGVRLDLPQVDVEMPVRCVRVADTPFPSFLIPSPTGLARVNLTGSVTQMPLSLPGIVDIAVHGEHVCAAGTGADGMLGIVNGSETLTIEVGRELAGVAFVDSETVAAWSTDGGVLLVNVETLGVTPAEFDKPVLAIHPAPAGGKPRPSRSVSERAVLAERGNLKDKKKEVGFDKRTVSAPATADVHLTQPASAASTARIRPAGSDADTTVSTTAPTPMPLARRGAHGSARQRGSISSLNFVREEEGDAPSSPVEGGQGPSWEMIEELRREIANLQMDMLRMGRGLKNEIRSAVAPLVDELRASRDTIAAQQAEIERLRRGY